MVDTWILSRSSKGFFFKLCTRTWSHQSEIELANRKKSDIASIVLTLMQCNAMQSIDHIKLILVYKCNRCGLSYCQRKGKWPMRPVFSCPDMLQANWSMSFCIVVIHRMPELKVITNDFRITERFTYFFSYPN